ncbi:MAG: 50S ribosomal protein L3 [Candidatus Altiarchaeales archaeon]|nr:50S ribosomal protein L3 [Candidatus Altiarchaeales archaeon]MBD3416334.1 50S ribosomal protein L3 [Candidatus Altiarchaeales archaeon]
MAKIHKPRAGSRAYRPLKRAKSEKPRIHSWPAGKGDSKVLGFTGYKAGMTHCIAVDESKDSPTSGSEVFVPVTILETPPMKVVGVRVYRKAYGGEQTFTDIWCETPDESVKRRASTPKKKGNPDKKIAEAEKKSGEISDVRLVAHTQPILTHSPKKTPDIMELALSGDVPEKLAYAKEVLGREITINDAFSESEFVDVTSVTKGKGFQGVVKRYGVKRQPRKASGKRRHLGTGGSWTPTKKLWVEPQPGQMGYHTRTEHNKLILKIGEDGGEVSPAGGFLRYGPVKSSYVMVYGSVPGPSKRVVRLTQPRRSHKEVSLTLKSVDLSSKQGA